MSMAANNLPRANMDMLAAPDTNSGDPSQQGPVVKLWVAFHNPRGERWLPMGHLVSWSSVTTQLTLAGALLPVLEQAGPPLATSVDRTVLVCRELKPPHRSRVTNAQRHLGIATGAHEQHGDVVYVQTIVAGPAILVRSAIPDNLSLRVGHVTTIQGHQSSLRFLVLVEGELMRVNILQPRHTRATPGAAAAASPAATGGE